VVQVIWAELATEIGADVLHGFHCQYLLGIDNKGSIVNVRSQVVLEVIEWFKRVEYAGEATD